ncbi:MAG: hypothetical protein GSR72_00400 [Desulfurococcales archaeon]|nr:hypothetical protein [Desulfurococcales archaeon]
MRGKSGLVVTLYKLLYRRNTEILGKITGLEPKIFYEGEIIDIDRGSSRKFFLDEENVGIIARYPAKIYIAENQAITRLTMKHFHRIYKPDIIVIPNVRYEHMEGLGETIREIAEAFALGFRNTKYVFYAKSTEKYDGEVEKIFRKYTNKYGVNLITIDIPEKERELPAIERIYLSEVILKHLGFKITEEEKKEIYNAITESLKPSMSPLGIEWYDASKVNDPESTELVIKYLLSRTNKPIYIFAYLRKDRVDRTQAFQLYFENLSKNDRIKKVWVAGAYRRLILKRLGEKGEAINEEDIMRIVNIVRSHNGMLILAVNGVNPFVDKVRGILSGSESFSRNN